jgi:beta-N-acetylhexosaminidase
MADPGLRALVLGTLLAAFPGAAAPPWALRLAEQGLAGYVLFARNVADPGQVAALTARLRDAGGVDLLLAVDEEGGDVTRLHHAAGSPYPGNAALGVVDDPALTTAVHAAIGADLVAAGLSLDLAPTVDVNTADDNPVIGTRSFGADPALVARHAAAAVTGLQDSGVAACVKHFPGHGATRVDSHLALPVVDASPRTLRERDLPPFVAAITAGARAVMSAHIRVPALTGDAPATFSPAALAGLLRGDLGFTGVVVTDALEMRGAAGPAGGVPAAAVAALAAGADLLCLGADVDADLVERTVGAVCGAVRDGLLDRRVLAGAAERVGRLRAWTTAAGPGRPAGPGTVTPGTVMPGTDFPGAETPGTVTPGTVTPGGHGGDVGLVAARRAVRVTGSPVPAGRPYLVHLDSRPTIAEGRLAWGLAAHVPGADQVRLAPAGTDGADLAARAAGRPVVVVARNLGRAPGALRLVGDLAARCPTVLVEMGWPARDIPAGLRGVVHTFGAGRVNARAAAEVLGLVPGP